MVDWRNPLTIEVDSLTLLKVSHFFAGAVVFEYISTFPYEWAFYTRKRPWRWTLLIYSGTRLSTLLCFVLLLVALSPPETTQCKPIIVTVFFFAFSAFALNTLLVTIRAIALWERRRSVIVVLSTVWLISVGVHIYSLTRFGAGFDPLAKACIVTGSFGARGSPFVLVVGDLIALIFMFGGVMRRRSQSSLWTLLYTQGIISIAALVVLGIPPVTFSFLDLNEPMNVMFHIPAIVCWTILVAKLYRSLDEFTHAPRSAGIFGTSYLSTTRDAETTLVIQRHSTRGTLHITGEAPTATWRWATQDPTSGARSLPPSPSSNIANPPSLKAALAPTIELDLHKEDTLSDEQFSMALSELPRDTVVLQQEPHLQPLPVLHTHSADEHRPVRRLPDPHAVNRPAISQSREIP